MYHVAILANLKKNAPKLPDQPPDAWADLDSDTDAPDCAAALAALLREAVMVRVAGVYHRAAEE